MMFAIVAAFILWAIHNYTLGFHIRPLGFATFALVGAVLGISGQGLWKLYQRFRSSS